MADTTKSSGSDLKAFYDKRYITPADLLDKLNPQKLKATGFGTPGIGGDPASGVEQRLARLERMLAGLQASPPRLTRGGDNRRR